MSPIRAKAVGLFVFLFLMVVVTPSFGITDSRPSTSVLLIVWDGVSGSVVRELLTSGALPNLASLASVASLTIRRTEIVATSVQVSTMLTGYLMRTHGVIAMPRHPQPILPIHDGWTIYERLKARFGTHGIMTAHIVAKPGWLSRPFLNAKPEIDIWFAERIPAEDLAPYVLQAIDTFHDNRFFIYSHFNDPDEIGHIYGVESPEYRNAIIACDSILGQILERLEYWQIAPKTRVVVTSDHGFGNPEPTGHMYSYGTFVAADAAAIQSNAYMEDVCPTLYMEFGIYYNIYTPPLPGKPLWS